MILIIDGPDDAAMDLAQSFRGAQINKGQGALIVQPVSGDDHALRHQIEKIMDGDPFPEGDEPRPANTLRWKKSPMVLVPSSRESVLDDIEQLVPGFREMHGPVSRMSIGK